MTEFRVLSTAPDRCDLCSRCVLDREIFESVGRLVGGFYVSTPRVKVTPSDDVGRVLVFGRVLGEAETRLFISTCGKKVP